MLPAQSWNSSQTSTGFSVFCDLGGDPGAATLLGRARAEAITPQKPMNSRRETPRRPSSLKNQLFESFIGDASFLSEESSRGGSTLRARASA